MYPPKFTESINIYQKTRITVNGVEHHALEKMESGPLDSQQRSQCFFNTTRGKVRPQDAQTSEIKFYRTERTSHCASDINPHCAFASPNF